MSQSALSHVRVLDLSRVLAGPWASQNLADLGAEVIKVERPNRGDDTRAWGPPYLQDRQGNDTQESAYYLAVNRGKKSIAIDIRKTEGQALIRKLAASADVLLENYKVGTLARYHLDYASLQKINPQLIYCSITGFGQTGPLSHLPGYDFIIQGMGGLMSVTGEKDELGGEPQKLGIAFADLMTGMYAAVAILAALEHRHVSGMGQYIDLALFDVQVASLANMNLNYLISKHIPERQGNAHPNIVPYQVFHSLDEDFIIAVGNDSQFRQLCVLLGAPEIADNPNFATNAMRVTHRKALVKSLQKLLKQRSAKDWIAALQKVGVPCGEINNIAQALENTQTKHRNMCFSMQHRQSQSVAQIASPMQFSETPIQYQQAPPTLGEHSDSVLQQWLGLSAQDIQQLRDNKVVY